MKNKFHSVLGFAIGLAVLSTAQAQLCIDHPLSLETKAKRLLSQLQASGNGIYCSDTCSGVDDITDPEIAEGLVSQIGSRIPGIRFTQFIPHLNKNKICLIVTNR